MVELRRQARDIMTRDPIAFSRGTPVKEAAETLSKKGIDAAPVVDDEGRLVGIISESDLIMQDVRLHFPTFINLLDGYIYVPSTLQRFEEEFRKAVGAKVGDVMTEDVVTARGDATVEDIATLMVDKDVDQVVIVEDGKPVGIVTKGDLVKAISRT